MSKAGRFAFGIVLVALTLGCQAKDYSERVGPYEINFTLPDNIASETNLNQTIINNVVAGGFTYDVYSINLLMPGSGLDENNVGIVHYNKPNIKNIDEISGNAKLKGITGKTSHQTIDGHEGVIISFYENGQPNGYNFMYQLDNETIVNGALSLDWDTVVQPFLGSLHITEVE